MAARELDAAAGEAMGMKMAPAIPYAGNPMLWKDHWPYYSTSPAAGAEFEQRLWERGMRLKTENDGREISVWVHAPSERFQAAIIPFVTDPVAARLRATAIAAVRWVRTRKQKEVG